MFYCKACTNGSLLQVLSTTWGTFLLKHNPWYDSQLCCDKQVLIQWHWYFFWNIQTSLTEYWSVPAKSKIFFFFLNNGGMEFCVAVVPMITLNSILDNETIIFKFRRIKALSSIELTCNVLDMLLDCFRCNGWCLHNNFACLHISSTSSSMVFFNCILLPLIMQKISNFMHVRKL